MPRFTVLFVLFVFAGIGCSPVSVTRIGPTQPNRGKGCEVLVLPPGEMPSRPYRDIGMVHLANCESYMVGFCRDWLIDSVCELGGNIAYLPERGPERSRFDAVNFRVAAAIYVVNESTPAEGEVGCKAPDTEKSDPETARCTE